MPTRGGAAGGPPLDERPAFAEFAHVREGELDDADASVGNVLEETLYGKTGETLGTHALNVDSEAKPPWGQVSGSVDFSHYLSQPESYRIESFGMIDIRLK